ncbi:MAG: hypothetical protein RJA34_2150 [Pseudomonadota bacterium]
MIEVKEHGIATVLVSYLYHHAGVLTLAIGRGELHHIPGLVNLVRIAQLAHQAGCHPLNHVRIALAKGGTSWQFKLGAGTLLQPQQARFHGRGQLAGAQGQGGRLLVEGVDHISRRARQAVVQGQKGVGLNTGGRGAHESLDKLTLIVERPAYSQPDGRLHRTITTPTMSLQLLPPDARPREKMLARGPGALSDAELLALLLRTGIQGKGVLQMADELLRLQPARGADPDRPGFDGIAGLLNATVDDLKRVKGLGPAKRSELLAVLELARRASAQKLRARDVFSTPGAVKQFFQLHLSAKAHEVFAVLFLDIQNRHIAMEEMFQGTLSQTSVYPREVVKRALRLDAAAVVLAHNHPSGSVQPSGADEALTRTLKAALALVDVRVLDHVIVGPGEALSMAERGYL